jgi:hypothetical protein
VAQVAQAVAAVAVLDHLMTQLELMEPQILAAAAVLLAQSTQSQQRKAETVVQELSLLAGQTLST